MKKVIKIFKEEDQSNFSFSICKNSNNQKKTDTNKLDYNMVFYQDLTKKEDLGEKLPSEEKKEGFVPNLFKNTEASSIHAPSIFLNRDPQLNEKFSLIPKSDLNLNKKNVFQESNLMIDKKDTIDLLKIQSWAHSSIDFCSKRNENKPSNLNEGKIPVNKEFEKNQEKQCEYIDKLNNFLPSSQKASVIISKNSMKIQFYDLNKEFMNIKKLNLGEKSSIRGFKELFCNFNHEISTLKFCLSIYETLEKNGISSEVLLFEQQETKKKYIVKRYLHNLTEKKYPLWQPYYENIIRESYREYALMKLFSMCPFSVTPKDIQFAYNENPNFLIVELLMDYGGENLKTIIEGTEETAINIKDALKYFRQLVQALNYLEVYKITHNDIKLENILLDLNENEFQRRVRLIDFNAGDNLSSASVFFDCGIMKGCTPAYAAPELAK